MSNTDHPDTGTAPFGGEKAKDLSKAENALPDEHANSTGRNASGEDIVAAEFSGVDNDLFDINSFAGEVSGGTGERVGPEDEKREALGGEPSAAQAVKERARRRLNDGDESSAAG